MTEDSFTVDQALASHQSLLLEHGGTPGVRDLGALESALAQPLAEFFGEQRFGGPISQAAAYLFFVIQAHAFVDGNKRTASDLCLAWLLKYSYVVPYQRDFERLARDRASGERTVEEAERRLSLLVKALP